MSKRHKVALEINGVSCIYYVEPRRLLSDFLREDVGLTGTHIGCEHGICGACTILLNGQAARSCLMFAVQADGTRIETVEGLSRSGAIERLQSLFAEKHALQCGYCTPAMLIIAHDLLRYHRSLSEAEIRESMSAALCRCTGYRGIIDAVAQMAEEATASGPGAPEPESVNERPVGRADLP